MRKLIVCAAMALTLGMAGLAQAGCTAEEAQQKAATFAQVVQAKAHVSFLFRGLYCPCLTVEATASGCEFVSMRYVH